MKLPQPLPSSRIASAEQSLFLIPARISPAHNTPSHTKHSPYALWHLLSFDAPTVAALWTCFIARSCNIAVSWKSIAAMFVAVWMLYAADRLLDARSGSASSDLEERHHFHNRHGDAFLAGIASAGLLLAALLPYLPAATLRLYAILGSLLVAYFLVIHLVSIDPSRVRLPKELAVGVFFSAAVFIPTVAREPMLRSALIPCGLLFGAVCTLNCLYIYAWEHPGKRTSAHWTTRFATRHLFAVTIIIALCGMALSAYQVLHSNVPRTAAIVLARPAFLSIACVLATVLLRMLHGWRHRFSAVHLRAAADFVLLTPLLLLPWL